MFSFFRRNKSKPSNNNNENANKVSINMQLAIEKQQASLHQTLEQKRRNDVNDREDKYVNSHTVKTPNDVDDRDKNRSTTLPSLASECDKTNVLPINTCAQEKQQNYDQFRDAKRSSYFQYDSAEHTSRQGNTPIHHYQPIAEKFSPIAFVASSIKDQKCSVSPGTSSTNAYNSVYEVMGRGRNRNKNRGGAVNVPQIYNKNVGKNQRNGDETVSKNVNEFREVTSENSNKSLTNIELSSEPQTLNKPASAVENSEKSASISNENVFHADDSCSINSESENKNDNIATTSDVGEKTAATETADIVSAHDEKSENLKKSVEASGMKNDEHSQQQVVDAVPLQRNPSAKRVTFAPSPPRSLASSLSDGEDDEEETLSEDLVFYEATETPSDTQKLRILSTVTSHSSDCTRIDEETSQVDGSTSNGASVSSSPLNLIGHNNNDNKNNNNNNKDIVCGKIILSVNESEKIQFSDNDEKAANIRKIAFNDDVETDSGNAESVPKTIKPSYMLVGEETIALPDIVAETSLLEQQQHHPVDEMANLASQASSYNGNSISSNQIVIVDQMQLKVNELCLKIDELERELDYKTGAVDRLQSELESANKEGECVRKRLRFQDAQLERVKENQDLSADEDRRKYVSLEKQYQETVGKLQKMQSLASNLNVQLAQASVDIEKTRQERDEILDKLTAQEKLLRDILETATVEREQIVAKWKHDFEQLRNVNSDREEHLMEDCEWKLRQMMKQCKEKMERSEKEKMTLKDQAQVDKQTIKAQRDEIKTLKACEKEAVELRSLTDEQKDSLSSMLKRIDDLKAELANLKRRLQDEIDSCLQIKRDCAYQLSEKERSALNRIEIARGEIAMEWEDRLMEEMCRLTSELEQVHLDERNSKLNELRNEQLLAIQALTVSFKQQEQKLLDEIATLKTELNLKQEDLQETQSKADMQLVESRAYMDKREREHQKEMDRQQSELERQLRLHSDLIEEIKDEHKREKEQIKASFYRSLEQIKEEFANEITLTTETLQSKHKRELEEQWKQLVNEKEAALQTAENRHRIRMEDSDNKLSALKLKHQRQLNDIQDQFDVEKTRNDIRDVSSSQEIDTLHRKCICLTKLFEEMRMRYERRDPRPEDLRQIEELKSQVDSQEKDIFYLTEQLRDLQLQQQQQMQNQQIQPNQQNINQSKRNKGKNANTNNNHNNKSSSKSNNVNSNGNSNNNTQQQMRQHASEPQQIKQNANHERGQQSRLKPPPLIKTIIYEDENEDELYEQQIREERENARRNQDEEFATELHHQQNGVTVELVPESPDYSTKHLKNEEISEAHIVSNATNIPDVVVISTPSSDDKLQELRVEVISTIEPAHIQVVNAEIVYNGNQLDLELD